MTAQTLPEFNDFLKRFSRIALTHQGSFDLIINQTVDSSSLQSSSVLLNSDVNVFQISHFQEANRI